MDHFVPAAIAEDRFDLGAAASCYALRIRRMVGHQPTREFASLRIAHNHWNEDGIYVDLKRDAGIWCLLRSILRAKNRGEATDKKRGAMFCRSVHTSEAILYLCRP